MSIYSNFITGVAGAALSVSAVASTKLKAPPAEPARAFYACVYQLDAQQRSCVPVELPTVIKNGDMELPPASLNKMMTVHLTLLDMAAKGKTLDDPFTSVTREDAEAGRYGERNGQRVTGGWTLRYNPKAPFLSGVPEDYVFTYRDVIYAMAVYSANDFAVAAARAIAPDHSLATFGATMNTEAKTLNMSNTEFISASGMPATGQHSSAKDMVTLVSQFVNIHGTDQFRDFFGRSSGLIAGKEVPGHLRLLKNPLAGLVGGKTGNDASGSNLAGYSERGNVGIAFTTLGSPQSKQSQIRDGFTMSVLNKIFAALGVVNANAKSADISPDVKVADAKPAKPKKKLPKNNHRKAPPVKVAAAE